MATLYMDGFNHYGPGAVGLTNMLANPVWSQVQDTGISGPSVPSWGARTDAYSLASGAGSTNPYTLVIPEGAQTAIYQSFGFSCDMLPAADNLAAIVTFCNGATIFANLFCQSDGKIALYDGSGGFITGTVLPVIEPASWHFIEMYFDPTGGNFTLRVDDLSAMGTPAITATGISFTFATVDQMQFLNTTDVGTLYLADLFIRNTTGSLNNSWIGSRQIGTEFVDGDHIISWVPHYYQKISVGILNVQGLHSSLEPVVAITPSASLNIGNSDFTLEGFVRLSALPTGTNQATIFSLWDVANNGRSCQLFLQSGLLSWQTSTDGTNSTVQQLVAYPWTPETDTWYNVALVRASGVLYLFVDGNQLGLPIADATTYFASTWTFSLGAEVTGNGSSCVEIAGTYLNGWIDEIRFTNGVGRYTSNYAVTTSEYPRDFTDPDFGSVVLLAGFDNVIQDESSSLQVMTSLNGAVQQVVIDGPLLGAYSTMDKPTPDDFTFLEAPFIAAMSILTLDAQPADGDTVTVGTQDGTTPAVYTFQTTLGTSWGDVLIDTNLGLTLQNLYNAINAGAGSGTKYAAATTANYDVTAYQLPIGQMEVIAKTRGIVGNSIPTSVSLTYGGGWTGSVLSGGVNIPGGATFERVALPPATAVLNAVQLVTRAFEVNADGSTMNTALVASTLAAITGPTHTLTTTPTYFNDVYETDPATSGYLTPATIIDGYIEINRDS